MKYTKKQIIETSIGLQDVDKIKNSSYFLSESNRYIKGEISLEELNEIITSYYVSKPNVEERSEEADKIAVRIAQIISEDAFTFTVGQLLSIHRTLFNGIIVNAGKLRDYNFTKKEWVLDGASVTYGDYRELEDTLSYDFSIEKKFKYSKLSMDEIVDHFAYFLSNLWQIHVFEEGNTRTTAVFFIKYLRTLGFDVTNDTFAKNSWFFRNALVRANYTNIAKGIYEDKSFLVKFLRNLLFGENHDLLNRDLHVNAKKIDQPIIELRQSTLISLLKGNSKITTEELSNKLNVSIRTIKSVLKKLQEDKIISREKGKKYGYWVINNEI